MTTSRPNRIAERLIEIAEATPAWLRPGFVGAAFIYGFMLMRGGSILFPIAVVYLAVVDPKELLVVVPAVLIVVPGAGFLGGLLYGVVGRFTKRLGKAGKVLQYIAATWVYCVLLVFVIMPWFDPKASAGSAPTGSWIFATGAGILFGTVLGLSATGVIKW
jgi:hypothetical protein